ncbi:hypothetical protein BC937DRAFT_91643 [Endogone sp. FLAS-F59071]|nr:hypothetical protein BC937DRAFT_91643 [Endogone sp. FLAS-F59071]|eukprot:RUS16064.1 hypothetical protein BC937DRAFT_91643 [Endogone sp. FLAS-F59071]
MEKDYLMQCKMYNESEAGIKAVLIQAALLSSSANQRDLEEKMCRLEQEFKKYITAAQTWSMISSLDDMMKERQNTAQRSLRIHLDRLVPHHSPLADYEPSQDLLESAVPFITDVPQYLSAGQLTSRAELAQPPANLEIRPMDRDSVPNDAIRGINVAIPPDNELHRDMATTFMNQEFVAKDGTRGFLFQQDQHSTYLDLYSINNYKIETADTVLNQNSSKQLSSQYIVQLDEKPQTHTDVLQQQQHGEQNSEIGNISHIPEHNNNLSRSEFFKYWYTYFGERKTLLADIVDPDGKSLRNTIIVNSVLII